MNVHSSGNYFMWPPGAYKPVTRETLPRPTLGQKDYFWQAARHILGRVPVYDRGAMTLQALREKLGDEVFSTILRTWFAENLTGNVTTTQLIALAERISGQQLDDFFRVWLDEAGRPENW